MKIALIQNGQITKIGQHAECFPNVSFSNSGPDDAFLTANSAKKVLDSVPYDPNSQRLEPVAPYIDGDFVYTVSAVALTADELEAMQQEKGRVIRALRNMQLASTDWTQLEDAPVDSVAWAEYRQELRDVTSQQGFPSSVNWPTDPNGFSLNSQPPFSVQ